MVLPPPVSSFIYRCSDSVGGSPSTQSQSAPDCAWLVDVLHAEVFLHFKTLFWFDFPLVRLI